MSFMNKELSDDLLPFSGKLSERFYEVRENVAGFCAEIEKIGAQLGSLPTRRPPLAHTAAPHPAPPKTTASICLAISKFKAANMPL